MTLDEMTDDLVARYGGPRAAVLVIVTGYAHQLDHGPDVRLDSTDVEWITLAYERDWVLDGASVAEPWMGDEPRSTP